MAVVFITTIIKAPDKDYLRKLKRVMKYSQGALGVKLTLRVYSLSVIKWWVNKSFVTHNNFWVNTGVMMYLGSGAITSGSWYQNINGRSSTENDLIRVNNIMVPVLWILYFVQGQGYTVESNIMFQYNHRTVCLMLNGKKYILKNTKHINVRYFFVKDMINRGEMLVEYCPT